jgi:23S rRNA-intervening sequence protein
MELTHRKISSYKDLIVWQKSIELVTEMYAATSTFPRGDVFGLTAQLRSLSVQQYCRRPGTGNKGRIHSILVPCARLLVRTGNTAADRREAGISFA